MPTDTTQIQDTLTRARAEVRKVIIGQEDVIDKALIAIFTGHHALIEGVPGVAKTLLVRTLARVLGCEFNRIQFTPDLMPADITGTSVFNMQKLARHRGGYPARLTADNRLDDHGIGANPRHRTLGMSPAIGGEQWGQLFSRRVLLAAPRQNAIDRCHQ